MKQIENWVKFKNWIIISIGDNQQTIYWLWVITRFFSVIDCLNMNLLYWRTFYPLCHSLSYILLLAYQCDTVCGQCRKYHDDAFKEFYHKVSMVLLICCIFILRPSFHCVHTLLHMWPCTSSSGEIFTYTLKLIKEAIPRLTLMRCLIQVSFAVCI